MRRGGSEGRDDAIHLGRDELFELLADSRRRLVVERLARDDRDAPTCRELAVEIAANETHMAPEQVPRRRVDPVEDDLRAVHLPGLVEAGLVRWDGGTGEVRPGHSVEAVAGLIREASRRVGRESAVPFSSPQAMESNEAHEMPSSQRT